MNILFLTISKMDDIDQRGIYTDLFRYFRDQGHVIYTVSSIEKREGRETEYKECGNVHYLYVKVGNITSCGIIEKGISTVRIERQFKNAIIKHLGHVKFDLVMYSTPPITFAKVIDFIKKRDGAKSYLLLKDIFPQNAVDICLLETSGIMSPLYKYFRAKEKKLYSLSDYIGCMSSANVDYILKHNTNIDTACVEICPNSIEIIDYSVPIENRIKMRNKYGIPLDKTVFLYGGNLGKPQGIDFFIQCLKACADDSISYFLIVGSGTEYRKIASFIGEEKLSNVKLIKQLPKKDYDDMVGSCDVGLIFLDYRFTIPNFPSRILSYMQAKIPVLAVTDLTTDIGRIAVENGFGWKCESNGTLGFLKCMSNVQKSDLKLMGINGYKYMSEHYDVKQSYEIIMKHFGGKLNV